MIKILVVDDDLGVKQSLLYHFEDSGYDVFSASSGEEAEALILSDTFDIVIVDLRLPNLRGDEFIKKIYDISEPTKFIIYTGSEEYSISSDLSILPRVLNKVYYKPLVDLGILNKGIESFLNFNQ